MRCNKCIEDKTDDQFRQRRKICRECDVRASKKYYWLNRKKCLERMRAYQKRRRSYIKEHRRQHYKIHRKEIIARARSWQIENPDRVRKNRMKSYWKIRARMATRKLKKQPCKKCGAKKVHAHHPDYRKPLKVIWLCPPCHALIHHPFSR